VQGSRGPRKSARPGLFHLLAAGGTTIEPGWKMIRGGSCGAAAGRAHPVQQPEGCTQERRAPQPDRPPEPSKVQSATTPACRSYRLPCPRGGGRRGPVIALEMWALGWFRGRRKIGSNRNPSRRTWWEGFTNDRYCYKFGCTRILARSLLSGIAAKQGVSAHAQSHR
jgi:hypothetical protein